MADKYVSPTGDDANSGDSFADPYATIQHGIDTVHASGGGVVFVAYGLYTERITIRSNVAVRGVAQAPGVPGVTIATEEGAGEVVAICVGKPTIDGTGSGTVVTFSDVDNAAIANFNIIRGRGASGGGIYLKGRSLTVDDSCITLNEATDRGGGVFVDVGSASVNITRNRIYENQAVNAGGGIAIVGASGVYVVNDNHVMYNRATSTALTRGSGGGIFVTQSQAVEITRAIILRNAAQYDGGGLYATDCGDGRPSIEVNEVDFTGNTTGHRGGGAAMQQQSWVNFNSCSFAHNEAAEDGGGASVANISGPGGASPAAHRNSSELCRLTECRFTGNSSADSGGGLYVSSASLAVITGCSFLRNRARSFGGAIHCSYGSALDIEETELSGNSADLSGGGISLRNSYLQMQQSQLRHNTSRGGRGGGLYVLTGHEQIQYALALVRWGFTRADTAMKQTVIEYNGSALEGGGVAVDQQHYPIDLTVDGCLIAGNLVTAGNGGGVHLTNVARAAFTGTQISLNATPQPATSLGGALYGERCAQLAMSGGSIARNSASFGGGGIGLVESPNVDIAGVTFQANAVTHPTGIGSCMLFVRCPSVVAATMVANNPGTTNACVATR